MANHSPRTSAQNFPSSFRCKPGDLVMVVRSKNQAILGRVGSVICATADASDLSHPDDLREVMRRDWVVDLQGGPDTYFRDGLVVITHRLACADRCLIPIGNSAAQADELEVDMPAEVAQ